MNFNDIFKKSFLEGFASADIGTVEIIVALGITTVLGLYIYAIYSLFTKKTFYSKNFNISLVLIAIITAGIILTIQSSVVISLGMVGALSIVRFRTAIKDPMDLVFLFWAISVGIICGAGLSEISVIMSIVLTIGIFILSKIPSNQPSILLIINATACDVEDSVEETLTKYCKNYKVKSRNMNCNKMDMIIEIKTVKEREIIKEISEIKNIEYVSLVSHDGEATY